MASFLTAHEARSIADTQDLVRVEILREIVQLAERKIKCAAALHRQSTDFSIPLSLTGLPMYNPDQMQRALLQHLKSQGFITNSQAPGTMLISWRREASSVPRPQQAGAHPTGSSSSTSTSGRGRGRGRGSTRGVRTRGVRVSF